MCYSGCHFEYEDGSCRLNNPTEADCEGIPEDEDEIIVDARGSFMSMEAVARLAGFNV